MHVADCALWHYGKATQFTRHHFSAISAQCSENFCILSIFDRNNFIDRHTYTHTYARTLAYAQQPNRKTHNMRVMKIIDDSKFAIITQRSHSIRVCHSNFLIFLSLIFAPTPIFSLPIDTHIQTFFFPALFSLWLKPEIKRQQIIIYR